MKNLFWGLLVITTSFCSMQGMEKKVHALAEAYQECEKRCYAGPTSKVEWGSCMQGCSAMYNTRLKILVMEKKMEQLAKNTGEKK